MNGMAYISSHSLFFACSIRLVLRTFDSIYNFIWIAPMIYNAIGKIQAIDNFKFCASLMFIIIDIHAAKQESFAP